MQGMLVLVLVPLPILLFYRCLFQQLGSLLSCKTIEGPFSFNLCIRVAVL